MYDWKLRYHSHLHVNTAQQDAMWLIDRVQLRGFWETSEAKDGKYRCPNKLGMMLFASSSFTHTVSRLEGRKPYWIVAVMIPLQLKIWRRLEMTGGLEAIQFRCTCDWFLVVYNPKSGQGAPEMHKDRRHE